VRSNEHIIEMEWAGNGGVASANNWECRTIAHNDGGRKSGGGHGDHTRVGGNVGGSAGVDDLVGG
jgi:hypothetical protein